VPHPTTVSRRIADGSTRPAAGAGAMLAGAYAADATWAIVSRLQQISPRQPSNSALLPTVSPGLHEKHLFFGTFLLNVGLCVIFHSRVQQGCQSGLHGSGQDRMAVRLGYAPTLRQGTGQRRVRIESVPAFPDGRWRRSRPIRDRPLPTEPRFGKKCGTLYSGLEELSRTLEIVVRKNAGNSIWLVK
jgi:hypothetical protein